VATDSIIITSGTSVSLGHDTCINTGGSYLLSAGAGATAYAWSSGAVTDTFRVRAAGTYSVTVTEGTCTASDTVVISICNHVIVGCAPVPYFRVLNVSPANTVTISDSSYNLYGAVHYYWNFGDGTGIDTTGSGTQVHTYGTPDLYTINLTVCDSCGCDTFSKVVQVNSDGISDINGLMDVNLYPNPASNTCTLEINASQNLELGIDVNNILGAVVQTRKWQVVSGENRMQLDVTDLASGMYTLTIRSSSGQAVRKLEIIK
jgi:PKD repeat protein